MPANNPSSEARLDADCILTSLNGLGKGTWHRQSSGKEVIPLREQYKALELAVIRFETEDVITTSCTGDLCPNYDGAGSGGGDD
jgi:hypothetical protein